jgi:hypothetical protein
MKKKLLVLDYLIKFITVVAEQFVIVDMEMIKLFYTQNKLVIGVDILVALMK